MRKKKKGEAGRICRTSNAARNIGEHYAAQRYSGGQKECQYFPREGEKHLHADEGHGREGGERGVHFDMSEKGQTPPKLGAEEIFQEKKTGEYDPDSKSGVTRQKKRRSRITLWRRMNFIILMATTGAKKKRNASGERGKKNRGTIQSTERKRKNYRSVLELFREDKENAILERRKCEVEERRSDITAGGGTFTNPREISLVQFAGKGMPRGRKKRGGSLLRSARGRALKSRKYHGPFVRAATKLQRDKKR